MNTTLREFENLVRRYVTGNVEWDTVHQYAVQMEWENKAAFSPIYGALAELHTIFLAADSKDDPQFRADVTEIAALVARLGAIRD